MKTPTFKKKIILKLYILICTMYVCMYICRICITQCVYTAQLYLIHCNIVHWYLLYICVCCKRHLHSVALILLMCNDNKVECNLINVNTNRSTKINSQY